MTTLRTTLAVLGLALVLVACGQSPAGSDPSSEAASTTATAAASVPACSNPDGGACLGRLAAGTYTSSLFGLGLTYTVTDGWVNFEDLPGQVAFVPPHGDVAGVNPGTSDFVGVDDSVAAASADCAEHAQADVDPTVDAMLEWYSSLEGLVMTDPEPVTVGGLEGFVTDVTLADGYGGTCPYPGLEETPMVPLIIGVPPAGLHHVVIGDTITRLYLLTGPDGQTIAIEVSEVPGGDSLDDVDAIVKTFAFG
jgi:CBS domain-containing protein